MLLGISNKLPVEIMKDLIWSKHVHFKDKCNRNALHRAAINLTGGIIILYIILLLFTLNVCLMINRVCCSCGTVIDRKES